MAIHIEGDREMAANLAGMTRALSKAAVIRELTAAAEPIRAKAASSAPRGQFPPHLADHIVIAAVEDEGGAPAVAIGPTPHFAYGRFQEWGTIHHPAQPFMRPGFDAGTAAAITRVGKGLYTTVTDANTEG